jgi:hypothetical protein
MRLPFEETTPRTLALFRAAVFGMWAVDVLIRPLDRLSGIPFAEIDPTGPLLLLPDALLHLLFSESGLRCLYFGSSTLALMAATGWRFRFTSTVACVLFILHASVRRSYAYVYHTDLALLLTACTLAGLAWADQFDDDGPSSERNGVSHAMWPLFVSMAILLLSYHFTGVRRIVLGGLEIYSSGSLPYWAARNALWEGDWAAAATGGIGLELARSAPTMAALRLGFPVITLIELLAPLALFYPRFRWIFLAIIVPFHLLSLPIFSLIFYQNLVLLAFLPDWDGLRAARTAQKLRAA